MASKFSGTKYRHIAGSIQKKELWYPDLKPTSGGGETNIIASSAYWIAFAGTSAGSVQLLQLDQPGKRKSTDLPTIYAHGNDIADLWFSPFRDDLLATSSEDSTVKIWTIPKSTTENINTPTFTLTGHRKRVDSVRFHPTASHILASGSSDKSLRVWDLESSKELFTFDGFHGDGIYAIDWNWDGSLLCTVAKDKKLRIIDPRANQVTQTAESHQGVKASRIVWLGESNKIATTGFSKMRERQFGLWDARDLSKTLAMKSIDSNTGVIDVFYDNDSNIVALIGKGDSGVKLMEISETGASDLAGVTSDTAQKMGCLVPKRAMDLMNTEIVRYLRLTNNAIAPATFSVPRKTKSEFQEDLYPPTKSTDPVLTTQQWMQGENKNPTKFQLKPTTNPYKFWEEDTSSKPSTTSTTTSSSSTQQQSTSTTSQTTTTESKAEAQQETRTSSPSVSQQSTQSTPAYVPKTVKVVRSSKFRHIVGKGTKMDLCYTNLRINKGANNSIIRANPTFFCIPWASSADAGLMAVFNLKKTGRTSDKVPIIECGSPCLDFDFNPFDDHMLATVTESAAIQIWKIPEGGLTASIKDPTTVMKGHLRRVTSVDFHPNVSNILVTTSGDNTVRLWDLGVSKEALQLEGPTDMAQSVTWNWNGSLLGVSSRDRDLRIYDPRSKSLASKTQAVEGSKGFKASWLGRTERLCVVGFGKNSERMLNLFDTRQFSTPLASVTIDNGSGVMTPFYDPDIGVMYLAGKGDGNIKMYEYDDEQANIFYLTDYSSTLPALGVAMLPKTNCNVRECEIARFIKLTNDYAEPLSFKVPRTRMEFFQDDLYPLTKKSDASLTSSEWLSGQNKEPEMISLQPSNMKPLSEAPVEQKTKKYEFNPNQPEELTREKVLDKYYQQMSSYKETNETVLKQDKMEGADASEWDD